MTCVSLCLQQCLVVGSFGDVDTQIRSLFYEDKFQVHTIRLRSESVKQLIKISQTGLTPLRGVALCVPFAKQLRLGLEPKCDV